MIINKVVAVFTALAMLSGSPGAKDDDGDPPSTIRQYVIGGEYVIRPEDNRNRIVVPVDLPDNSVNRDVVTRDTPTNERDEETWVMELGVEKVTQAFGSEEWPAFKELIQKESSWEVGNINPFSGACGLGQAYPCDKLPGGCLGDASCELDWAIGYIQGKSYNGVAYNTPKKALHFWKYIAPTINGHNWY